MNFKKILFLFALVFLVCSNFDSRYPDALKCGQVPSYGAIYFAHSLSGCYQIMYCQISTQKQCVYFNEDGSYKDGVGEQGSRKGCTKKSLKQLRTQGRAYDLTNNALQQSVNALKAEVAELRKLITGKSNNFWDYEQIKQKWYKQFSEKLLRQIKKNGIQIGERWKIQQQTSFFVIRDIEGTKSRDSRIAFPADTYLDPR